MTWATGEVIVHQEVWRGRVWAARPLVVVSDEADRLVLWLPHGTRRRVPAPPAHRADAPDRRDPQALPTEAHHIGVVDNLALGDWVHVEHVWDVSTLWLLRPGERHATWTTWLPTGEHLGWYVNLQEPFRRTPIGIQAMDLMLDVVVEPDRSWRWKDAGELDEIEARGIFDAATIAAVRAEAHAVIAELERGAEPFCEPWPTWRPDPAWPVPELPDGWDRVP